MQHSKQNIEQCKKEKDIMQMLTESNAPDTVAFKGFGGNDEHKHLIAMEKIGDNVNGDSLDKKLSDLPQETPKIWNKLGL